MSISHTTIHHQDLCTAIADRSYALRVRLLDGPQEICDRRSELRGTADKFAAGCRNATVVACHQFMVFHAGITAISMTNTCQVVTPLTVQTDGWFKAVPFPAGDDPTTAFSRRLGAESRIPAGDHYAIRLSILFRSQCTSMTKASDAGLLACSTASTSTSTMLRDWAHASSQNKEHRAQPVQGSMGALLVVRPGHAKGNDGLDSFPCTRT